MHDLRHRHEAPPWARRAGRAQRRWPWALNVSKAMLQREPTLVHPAQKMERWLTASKLSHSVRQN